MKPIASTVLLFTSLLVAPIANAQTVVDEQEIYRAGAWNVAVASLDDGSNSCIASVDNRSSWFSLWANDDDTVFLGVTSPGIGEMSKTEPLSMEIDRRGLWDLINPDAVSNDDFYVELGGDRSTERVIEQLMLGRTLAIKNSSGAVEESFSLSGSNRAIQALIGCLDGITGR